MEKFDLPERLRTSTSVFNEFIALAMKYKPLNVAQGCTDGDAPEFVVNSLKDVLNEGNPLFHQYTRGYGHLRLVQALSKLYTDLIGRQLDPLNNILITIGAYGALYCSILGHVDAGDEVIIIEPFFDCYSHIVKMANGAPRFIPLKLQEKEGPISSANWVLDDAELEKLFNEKTKMIILNTPHNPTGKVFHRKELERIAELCRKWNVLCVSDEVYEWLVFDGMEHIRICTLPGMWDRTITIGSAGKTFSVTGWKLGWAYGPQQLLRNLQKVHENMTFNCPTLLQEAIARSFEIEMSRLGKPESYFSSLPRELQPKRDFMAKFITEAGMRPTIPEGGFFMVSDWSPLAEKVNLETEQHKYQGYKFAIWMTKNVGIQSIPVSAFCSEGNKQLGENFVRYCFYKKDEKLEKAAEVLKTWRASML